MKSVVLDAMKYVDFKAKYILTVIILAILCTACGKEKEEQGNAYFYKADETVHTYEGYFYLHSYTDLWQDVDLYITRLENFSKGTLYTLELEQPVFSDPYDELLDRKYIGYFYVTDEMICYLPAEEDGYTDENNRRVIAQIRKDEENPPEQGMIVCCEDGMEDDTDENGYHAYVQADGDKRIFRYYNDYFYGSKEYIMMVWEKGKGITYYMHGNGAKNLHVEFGEHIKEAQEVDYGYPYKMFHEESSIYTEKLLQVCHNVRVLITELNDGSEDMVEREDTCESASSQEDTKRWPDRIYEVTADNMQGNILGYSLIRQPPNPDNRYYERDLPYLLEESMVGKGIYISDYMCETEVFLGNLLKEVIRYRGTVNEENRQYFTEYALQRIDETDWDALDAGWEAAPYAYDRTYQMMPVAGGYGYQFYYCFYPEEEETSKKESAQVEMTVYVDGDGRICEIRASISMVPAETNRMVKYIQTDGLSDNTYREQVILDGSPCREELVWDFEKHFRRFMYPDEIYEQENNGLLAFGTVCDSAENLADIFLHVIGNRGADVEKYAKWFGYESYFTDFADSNWGLLEENWTADEEYDCFFIDRIEDAGYVGFQYYFYPDFADMDVDTAKMAVIACNVDITYGTIDYNRVDIFPITEEAYLEMKQKQTGSRVLVVDKGTALLGKEMVAIPVLDRPVEPVSIAAFDPDTVAAAHSGRKEIKELWGFADTAQAGSCLGEMFLRDLVNDYVEEGVIYKSAKNSEMISAALYTMDQFLEAGWKVDEQYDCYYIGANEAAGCMHFQYYFYPADVSDEQVKNRTLVADVYLSEAGIERMAVEELGGQPQGERLDHAYHNQGVQTKNSIRREESIYDKNFYDSYLRGKFMGIRFQEENFQQELEDYFEVEHYAEGTEILVDMFLDQRTCEMEEQELQELFYEHGYLLHLHHKEAGGLHIRLIEVQEIDGLSLYPVRIAIQTWDEENLYLEDITAPIPRKIRDFVIIEKDDVLRMIIHSSGVSVDYAAEEELSFWEFSDSGDWNLTPMDLEIDTSHAHNTGEFFPDLDRDTLFPMTFYQDGITFGPSRQGQINGNGVDTFRLGKLEETEQNKSFRLYGIFENLGRTFVWEYGDCYIEFHVV